MKILFKFINVIFLSLFFVLLIPASVKAVCPVCTVAVAGGLGLSRWLGIDDSISGIWVGGLMVSLSFWTADWLQKKKWKSIQKLSDKKLTLILFAFWSLITFLPLYWTNIIGHPYNTIAGIDKLLFGSIIGAVAFLLGVFADKRVRYIKGRQLFNYQKVVFPFISLVITSVLLYYYGGYIY